MSAFRWKVEQAGTRNDDNDNDVDDICKWALQMLLVPYNFKLFACNGNKKQEKAFEALEWKIETHFCYFIIT